MVTSWVKKTGLLGPEIFYFELGIISNIGFVQFLFQSLFDVLLWPLEMMRNSRFIPPNPFLLR